MYIKNEKLYHILLDVAQIYLPAFATFYATLGDTWHLPYNHEIAVTIIAFDTFMGACLKASTRQYLKGGKSDD